MLWVPAPAMAQLDYERKPISYSQTQPTDRIAQLADRLKRGEFALKWNRDNGYLTSVLAALEVPVSSQTLVFSRTSLELLGFF